VAERSEAAKNYHKMLKKISNQIFLYEFLISGLGARAPLWLRPWSQVTVNPASRRLGIFFLLFLRNVPFCTGFISIIPNIFQRCRGFGHKKSSRLRLCSFASHSYSKNFCIYVPEKFWSRDKLITNKSTIKSFQV